MSTHIAHVLWPMPDSDEWGYVCGAEYTPHVCGEGPGYEDAEWTICPDCDQIVQHLIRERKSK